MKHLFLSSLIACTCLFTGCLSYDEQAKQFRQTLTLGNFSQSALLIADKVRTAPTRDQLIWNLEAGATFRIKGDIPKSQTYFDTANNLFERYHNTAKVSVSGEAAALFTNPASLPYRGMYLDGIMINVYQALNYLSLNNPDAARVSIIRAYDRQQEAVLENEKRIAAARNANKGNKEAATFNKAEKSTVLKKRLAQDDKLLPDTRGYENYVNPFAVYLDGLYHAYYGVDASDRERSRMSLARALAFSPKSTAIAEDLEAISQGNTPPPCVYLIVESGLAPHRQNVQFFLPLIGTRIGSISFAYPKLLSGIDQVKSATIAADHTLVTATPICNMSAVVAQEFKNDRPAIIARAMLNAITKTTAIYLATKAAERQDALVGLGVQLGGLFYQAATTTADTRCWHALPATFHLAKLPLPQSRKVSIALNTTARREISLPDQGSHFIIYLRAPTLIAQNHQVIRLK